jgi:hypothetical protein
MSPNKKAFKEVCERLAAGEDLTFDMIGSVFHNDFWCMLVMAFMDSNDAARAISGAISRLRQGEEEERLVN